MLPQSLNSGRPQPPAPPTEGDSPIYTVSGPAHHIQPHLHSLSTPPTGDSPTYTVQAAGLLVVHIPQCTLELTASLSPASAGLILILCLGVLVDICFHLCRCCSAGCLLLATVGGEDAVTIALEERRWPELDHRD